MPKFRFSVPYTLSEETIKEKVEKEAGKMGAKADWKKEDECHFDGQYKGVNVSGFFKIKDKDKEIDITLNLPLVAMPFKGKIKERVTQELNKE